MDSLPAPYISVIVQAFLSGGERFVHPRSHP